MINKKRTEPTEAAAARQHLNEVLEGFQSFYQQFYRDEPHLQAEREFEDASGALRNLAREATLEELQYVVRLSNVTKDWHDRAQSMNEKLADAVRRYETIRSMG